MTASSLLIPVGRHPTFGARTCLPHRSLIGAQWRSALSTVGTPRELPGLAELMMDTAVSSALKGKNMDEADLGEGPTAPHPMAKAEFK